MAVPHFFRTVYLVVVFLPLKVREGHLASLSRMLFGFVLWIEALPLLVVNPLQPVIGLNLHASMPDIELIPKPPVHCSPKVGDLRKGLDTWWRR
jgi:hypothetical protein